MSTEDERLRHGGDYNSGTYTRGAETHPGSGSPGLFEDERGYDTGPTTVLPAPGAGYDDGFTDEGVERRRPPWHAGADIGLLVLRLVVGALFIAHGLQALFGWFQGGGISGTADQLAGYGFSNTTALAWVNGLAELVGGTFVALGLFTPAGAAAILGVMASAIVVRYNGNDFAGAVELESVYAAAAFAILFAGPGRVSLDRPTPWYRHAPAYGAVFLLIAAGAAVAILLVFR